MGNLNCLKEQIFCLDNRACFIERERILGRLEVELRDYDAPDRYARILAVVLAEVSTPIDEGDYFVGRVVEALPDEEMRAPSDSLLSSIGHMSFDYEKLLRLGLKGILEEIKTNAEKKGSSDAISFAKNAFSFL